MKNGKQLGKGIGKLVVIPVLGVSLAQTSVFANAGGTASTMASSATSLPQQVTVSAGTATESSVPVVVSSDADAGKVKFTQEQAIAKLRELFPALKEAEVERVELGDRSQYPPPENQMVWQIHWQYRKGNHTYGFSSTVDAVTGDVLNIHLIPPLLEESEVYYPPKVSREKALQLAVEFIRKAVPSLPDGKLMEDRDTYRTNQPLFGPVRYHFMLYPAVNGIPSPSDRINITVDGNGNVLDFYRNMDVLEYPATQAKISLEEAKRKYRENLKLTLQYIPISDVYGEDSKWFLGWVPDRTSAFRILDAVTGEFLNGAGEPVKAEAAGYEELPAAGTGFQPAKPAGGQFLTAEEAAKIVEKAFQIPAGKTLVTKMLEDDYRDRNRKVWRLIWSAAEGVPFGPYREESYAVVDARTGQVLEYREEQFAPSLPTDKQGEEGKQQGRISPDEARKRAMELVQRLYPNARAELKWVKQDLDLLVPPSESSYSFIFQRFYQNRPVEGNGVNITLDASGKIRYYSANVTAGLDEKLKGLEPKISEEEARAKYLANTDLQLQYTRFGGYWTTDNGYVKPLVKMVYQEIFKNGMNFGLAIDAADGRLRSRWLPVPAEETVVQPVDIDNHPAEEELRTMVQYGILQPDSAGRLEPDRAITRGEWLQMMAKAVDPYYQQVYYSDYEQPAFKDVSPESPYYKAAIFAVQRQWLEDKMFLGVDQPLTREELAVSLAHILGYDKLAKILANDKDLLAGFRDADQIKEKGAVYIAHQLGLLTAANGTFNPNGKVTRADAAVVMMRLVRLQGKTDNKINGAYY